MLENILDELLRRNELYWFYTPISFLRQVNIATGIEALVLSPLQKAFIEGRVSVYNSDEYWTAIWWENLPWDTQYFGFPHYRIKLVVRNHESGSLLAQHLLQWQTEQLKPGDYLFTETPTEDVQVLQAMSASGFALIETRLTYKIADAAIRNFQQPRYPVRQATVNDIPLLAEVSSRMVNIYDRFHADPAYTKQQADAFLGTYVTEAIKGFADYVIMPDEPALPNHAFLTTKFMCEEGAVVGSPIARNVLTAVSPVNRGWNEKLISEITYWHQAKQTTVITMTTQTANRAVPHVLERLGYKYGCTTHIFSRLII